ncbi:MAG: alpha/beta hydrolase [Polyangiaceae bacterium]|nr:alpha/beta hydrolase [Polyangiaceae bacterium]
MTLPSIGPPHVLFAWGALAALSVINARWPFRPTVTVGTVAFFAGWLTCELALHHAALHVAALAAAGWLGAATGPWGWTGAALTAGSVAGLVALHLRGQLTGARAREALSPLGVEWDTAPVGLGDVLSPFTQKRAGVVIEWGLPIHTVSGHTLRADVFHRADRPAGAPVLVYVHGGGWVVGFRRFQGGPLLSALAAAGWVCVRVSYRLSPGATFPEHVHDVARGLAWAKANAARWGGDGAWVAIAGNSAGAHLSSTLALGHDVDALVPEELRGRDLSVRALVGLYGVYDFTNRHGHWPGLGVVPFLERVVMKERLARRPELFRLASPVDLVRPDAPPTLLVHGDRDTLAPVRESRRLCDALARVSAQPVLYLEVPDAQHAFEIFHSVRGRWAVRAIVAFLQAVRARA